MKILVFLTKHTFNNNVFASTINIVMVEDCCILSLPPKFLVLRIVSVGYLYDVVLFNESSDAVEY